MAKYIAKEKDQGFRKVNIRAVKLPNYEKIEEPGQVISYPDQFVVLEVLKEDGSSELFYDGPKMELKHAVELDKIVMGIDAPLERLWVRRKDGEGICFKVPEDLPETEGRIEMVIPGEAKSMELFGDPYCRKVYNI